MEGQVMDAVSIIVGTVTFVLMLAGMFTENKNNTLAGVKVFFMVAMAIWNLIIPDADIIWTWVWIFLACLNIGLTALRINTKSQ